MKKDYLSPKIEVVKVATVLLQEVSMNVNGNYGNGSGLTLGAREDDMDEDWD